MSGNNLKVSGIINLPSLGSLRGKLLCPEQYIEGFASVPVGIVEESLTVTDFGGLDVGIPQAMRRSIDFAANSHGIGAG